MSGLADAPYLYLYVQCYRLASQEQSGPPKEWHEYFYASDDGSAKELAQNILAMKNARAVLPYVETSLERSSQDVHIDYYLLPAIKERQPNGAYYAASARQTKNEDGSHVLL
ncbi:MAG TPA: hypothetical protein VFV38_21505 [Ktedonobacteraceae bacterium]|nr:hypothetical protein [Ktedonobacteraceae bacterium]